MEKNRGGHGACSGASQGGKRKTQMRRGEDGDGRDRDRDGDEAKKPSIHEAMRGRTAVLGERQGPWRET
jgi:hypothetical protein